MGTKAANLKRVTMKSSRDTSSGKPAPKKKPAAKSKSDSTATSEAQKAQSRSERKRNREHNRRMELAGSLDDLCKILQKIDPTLMGGRTITSTQAKERGAPIGVSLSRVELLNLAVETLERLHNENEERKITIERLTAVVSSTTGGDPTSPRPESINSGAGQTSQHFGQQRSQLDKDSTRPDPSSSLHPQGLRHLEGTSSRVASLPPDPSMLLSLLQRRALQNPASTLRFGGPPGFLDQTTHALLNSATSGVDPVLSLTLAQRRLALQTSGYDVARAAPHAHHNVLGVASSAPTPTFVRSADNASSLDALIASNIAPPSVFTAQSPPLEHQSTASTSQTAEEMERDLPQAQHAKRLKRSRPPPEEDR